MILPPGYAWIRRKVLHQSIRRHQFYILILTFLVYVLYHASRKPLSVVKTVFHKRCDRIEDRASNWCQWRPFDGDDWSQLVGYLEYAFLLCYSFAMFPCGHLAERMSLRIFLVIGMVASGLTTIMFGLGYYFDVHVFSYYLAAQVFGGIAQATGWPAVVTIMSNWFGRGRRGLIMCAWNAHTNVGNVLGSIIAGAFVSHNWGASFLVPGVLLLLFAYVVFMALVDQPSPDLGTNAASVAAVEERRRSFSGYYSDVKALSDISYKEQPISFCDALKLPNVVTYAMALFFSKLVSYTFLYWLPNYLANVASEAISAERAAWLSTIFDLGGIVGGVIAGLLSDSPTTSLPVESPIGVTALSPLESSFRTIYLRAVTCASMLAIAAPALFYYQSIASSMSLASMVLLFLCGGLVTGPCALITTAVSADLGTQPILQGNAKALATVTAIIDGTGSLGAALGPLLTGILVYHGWRAVFAMLIVANLVAMSITLLIACRTRNTAVYRALYLPSFVKL